ncbi:putative FmdB family regulatory protein [Alteromonadaceae bacterium 2753L.S.0a.02]|nr:putative FmdB family regulatory protein [Alteromonadaceae bacterium 2753L.S.0a.02]
MPVYDYKCQDHGIFNELATIDDAAKPAACPTCGKMSGRVIMLSPEFLNMDPDKRHAEMTNEKARHEPEFSTKERREHDHQHKHGCGCNKQKPGKSNLIYTAQGEKMFPSMRPWMISH